MLHLDRATMFGKGLHRECFFHPADPALCIKIVVAGDSDENTREAKYYRMLSRRGISWERLTRFHGLVETDRGRGAVFDLVRDHDGNVSQTLSHYLEGRELAARYGDMIGTEFQALKAYLLDNRIITMTLKPKNILFQRQVGGGARLVIVDNVGNSDFLPLSNYSGFLARRKIERKWRRFEYSLAATYAGAGQLLQLSG